MNARRYQAASADDMLLRPLDDLVLLYHRSSGQTHMVASPVPEILAELGDKALHLEELRSALEQNYDLGEPEAARAELSQHLGDLCALGLVRTT
ncbi:MAG: HPr-rel-A system PqqD family peptide chaperone [Sphingobium sp.]